jgi:IS5 family transposase
MFKYLKIINNDSMISLKNNLLKRQYDRVNELWDKLAEVTHLIDWEVFRPIIKKIYNNQSEKGGKPNTDEIIMLKMLIIQAWYGLSDPELENKSTTVFHSSNS